MNIAILGAGIAGLRAALELAPTHKVTVFEKSPGVGGRVATRRFGDIPVNHGAPAFDRPEPVSTDPASEIFRPLFSFEKSATDLPKAMRDALLGFDVRLQLNTRIGSIHELDPFDAVIMTAPVPQVRELLGSEVLPEVTYEKALLFIGVRNGTPVVERIDDSLFELPEEEIRQRSGINTDGLTLKKWRYARVRSGIRAHFHRLNQKILIAGDAFDPDGVYDIASAWNSGRHAGSSLV